MTGLLRIVLAALLLAPLLAGCDQDAEQAALPAPQEPGATATGYFCGMTVTEHRGPKGQVFLAGDPEPLWFSSVRDALAFTMLPERPGRVTALYVNDMAGSADGVTPQPGAWVLAEEAHFVAGSGATGGMGAPEVMPFADRAAAERYRAVRGGEIHRLDGMPERFVLGPGPAAEGGFQEEDGHALARRD